MSADIWTTVPTLAGRHVRLEPLGIEHAQALGQAASDGELWTLAFTSAPHPDEAIAYVTKALSMHDAGDALPFVVRDATGGIVGSTRFYHLDPTVPRVHIGYTWYAQRVQRTALNTDAKRLLLSYAFDTLGCEAVAFETGHLNHRSQTAIERLGAKRDGVLRAHMRQRDGSLRDTWVYSIVAEEWPQVNARLGAWLEADHV